MMKSAFVASGLAMVSAVVDPLFPPFGYASAKLDVPEGETGSFIFDLNDVSDSPYPAYPAINRYTNFETSYFGNVSTWPSTVVNGFVRILHFRVSRDTLNLADEASVDIICDTVNVNSGNFTRTSGYDLDLCVQFDMSSSFVSTFDECSVVVTPSSVLLGDFSTNSQATAYAFNVYDYFNNYYYMTDGALTEGGCANENMANLHLPIAMKRPALKESLSVDSQYFVGGFDATQSMGWAGQSVYITQDISESSNSLYALVDPTVSSMGSTFQLCYSTDMPFDESTYFGDYSMGLNTTICDQGCYPNVDCTASSAAGTLEDQSGTAVMAPLYATLFVQNAVLTANAQTAFAFGHFPDAAAGVAPSVLAVFAAFLAIM